MRLMLRAPRRQALRMCVRLICVGVAVALAGCRQTRPRPPDAVVIHVGSAPVAEVDDRFLSVAIDAAQLVGGGFWNPDGSTSLIGDDPRPPFDFAQPKLLALARPLAPAYLRLGGSAADLVYYDVDGAT